jgi:tRNA (cytosine38-C5)-methyltransferase
MKRTTRDLCSVSNINSVVPQTLRYVELFAGLGGWSFALQQVVQAIQPSVSLVCAAALDHSDLCMAVYQHNHGRQQCHPSKKNCNTKAVKNIEDLTLEHVLAWQADVFLMSPPCQPHSRQHSNQDADLQDPRSKGFLHLCRLLEQIPENSLPKIVLLENVVGFEVSNSCCYWRRVLATRNYRTGHFHLQPTQVGLPNDRPRYYCVAVHDRNDSHAGTVPDNCWPKDPSSLPFLNKYLQHELCDSTVQSAANDKVDLILHTDLNELNVGPIDSNSQGLPTLQEFLDTNRSGCQNLELRLSEKVLRSNAAWCIDLVTPSDRRSACFTSSYGKFIRGTGSVLYTGTTTKSLSLSLPQDREFDPHWADQLDNVSQNLRYFSGLEMSRLFGFPSQFSFPDEITLRQQWKLMGNALNVTVAGRLIELALCVLWNIPPFNRRRAGKFHH